MKSHVGSAPARTAPNQVMGRLAAYGTPLEVSALADLTAFAAGKMSVDDYIARACVREVDRSFRR